MNQIIANSVGSPDYIALLHIIIDTYKKSFWTSPIFFPACIAAAISARNIAQLAIFSLIADAIIIVIPILVSSSSLPAVGIGGVAMFCIVQTAGVVTVIFPISFLNSFIRRWIKFTKDRNGGD
jgi:hypothetical protein